MYIHVCGGGGKRLYFILETNGSKRTSLRLFGALVVVPTPGVTPPSPKMGYIPHMSLFLKVLRNRTHRLYTPPAANRSLV